MFIRPHITILSLLLLNPPVLGQNVTAAAQAGDRVGWVSPPNTRSTSEILFSCLSIFLLCSWKCVHPNVPSIEESEAGWHSLWGWIPYWPTAPLRRLWGRRIGWMALIVIAPEIGVTMAYVEFMSAREMFKKYQDLGFTMTHAFYAYMGGYRFALPRVSNRGDTGDLQDDQSLISGTASAEDVEGNAGSGYSVAKGLDYYNVWGTSFGKNPMVNCREGRKLEELGLFPATDEDDLQNRSLPVVKEHDIHNASTSDAVTKGLACLQCGWLVIQSIARAAAGLPLTELELMTLAFIFCALIMYGLWWNKPFGVQRATVVFPLDPEKARAVLPDLHAGEPGLRLFEFSILHSFGVLSYLVVLLFDLDRDIARAVVCNGTSILFSGFHLIAWDWAFPSDRVQLLWRIFSVAATGAPLVLTTLMAILPSPRNSITLRKSAYLVVFGTTVVYTISRVGLIVLVFYCFSSMPAAVYETVPWSTIFPHLS
ncbi:hypothetical protein BO78DRAFT_378968 [Aspergillus sclerotiicarbonarius CBS 121057]|uniref:Uncharacterized protein n=1 Tax=Aspergillus sclerotiicarbonarius (strain CBS 121057 / IBT 28362) TaxID=1448318 RepID=A0A319DUM9_ASPSB|nr:hypothetical protein BO78DRAFT_378968 [Aspergillus sclerotiicarbonarius CBS 121057]